jgi:hypothetical protein
VKVELHSLETSARQRRIEALKQLVNGPIYTDSVEPYPQVYESFLGVSFKDQLHSIAEASIPGDGNEFLRRDRRKLFEYILNFLRNSTFKVGREQIGKGLNLATRPFLAPTGFVEKDESGNKVRGAFCFMEQYRWDTWFQNLILLMMGGIQMAVDQLLNLVDVYHEFGRISNALTTEFLSHPQPPFEGLAAIAIAQSLQDLAQVSIEPENWYQQVMETIRDELFSEWWDAATNRINPRQTPSFIEDYSPLLSRYVSIHFHPLLVGCQDGKDHNYINAKYGQEFIPVQLNSLIWKNLCILVDYYQQQGDEEQAKAFFELAEEMKRDMNHFFWQDEGPWRGFRNYSIRESDEGPILYGDLSAEIMPLFVGWASQEQARITLENVKKYYQGDIGLAATSEELRVGGSITHAPEGFEYQWEENAWPPLMIMAVLGFKQYSQHPGDEFDQFVLELEKNWVKALEKYFLQLQQETGRGVFYEKMPHSTTTEVNDGFYGNLPGFGWTIASYMMFIKDLAERGAIDWTMDDLQQSLAKGELVVSTKNDRPHSLAEALSMAEVSFKEKHLRRIFNLSGQELLDKVRFIGSELLFNRFRLFGLNEVSFEEICKFKRFLFRME